MSLSIGCTDWYANDIKIRPDDKGRKYVIYAFGRTAKGTLVSLLITGFKPCGYIEIPMDCKLSDTSVCSAFHEFFTQPDGEGLPYYAQKSIASISIVHRNRFRGFDADTSRRYLRVECESRGAIRAVSRLFLRDIHDPDSKPGDRKEQKPKPVYISGVTKGGKQVLSLNEFGIDPLLRFFHQRNIKPAHWINIPKQKLNRCSHKTRAKFTFFVDWEDIRPIEVPPCEIPWKVASFDIECLSSHGDFPQAIKDYKKHARDLVELVDNLPKTDRHLTHSQFRNFITHWFLGSDGRRNEPCIVGKWDGSETLHPSWTKIHGIFTKRGAKPTNGQVQSLLDHIYEPIFEPHGIRQVSRIYQIAEIMKDILEPRVTVSPDPVVQIGTSFWKYGDTTPYRHTMITLGPCAPIDGVEVTACKTEAELLTKWAEIMTQEMPDILTGYNIFGFDIPYLYKRSEDEGVLDTVFKLSRFQELVSELRVKKIKGIGGALVDQEYVETPGLVQLDLMKIMQRDHNLDSYKLDNVAATFLRGKVKELMFGNKSRGAFIKTNSVAGLEPGNSISLRTTSGYVEETWGLSRYEVSQIDRTENKIYLSTPIDDKMKIPDDLVWCMGKNDVSPQDIFRLCKGSAEDQRIVAKYCVQDVVLVIHLVRQLQVLPNNVAMGNVCSVPFGWIVARGQGVKIQSLVAKQCAERKFILPDLDKSSFGFDTFEGAIVLPPVPGLYLEEPVAVLDYASLYPSSMISMNLSHECYCDQPEWQGDDGADKLRKLGYEWEDIEYDTFRTIYTPSGLVKAKEKTGVKTVRFVQKPKGIIPEILENLLAARKETRKRMKYKTIVYRSSGQKTTKEISGIPKEDKDAGVWIMNDERIPNSNIVEIRDTYSPFEIEVMDGQQLAYKVTANSLYGQIGARTSYIYWKDIAAATTATGRKQLEIAQTYCENERNFPQKLEDGNTIYLKNKVVYGDSVTENTPVLIRNSETKQVRIIAISELNDQMTKSQWEEYRHIQQDIQIQKESIDMNKWDAWTNKGWSPIRRVIRHRTKKSIYRVLTHTGMVDVTEDHSLIRDNGELLKPNKAVIGDELLQSYPLKRDLLEIPIIIRHFRGSAFKGKIHLAYLDGTKSENHIPHKYINAPIELIFAFLSGYCQENEYYDNIRDTSVFRTNNQRDAASLIYLFGRIGLKALLNVNVANQSNFEIRLAEFNYKNLNKIKKIHKLRDTTEDEYVYDIETAEGVFQAGIGDIIVKNTDSVFVKYDCRHPDGTKMTGRDALKRSIELGCQSEKGIQKLLKDPQRLEYEKTFWPFILFTKKRYVGDKYEFNPNKAKRTSMGIVLKRRDNAPIVKVLFGGCIDTIMETRQTKRALDELQRGLFDLIRGQFDLSNLVITKTLAPYYKKPDTIAHRVLADRIAERDPGNAPQVNDRIPYVHIKIKKAKSKIKPGDNIEHPEFVKENNLKIDYGHYISNQIMKPVSQIFALAPHMVPGSQVKETWLDEMWDELEKKGMSREEARKKAQERSQKIIQKCLFDDVLIRVKNTENRQRDIRDFFGQEAFQKKA